LSAIATTKKIINLIKKKSGQIYYSNTHQGHSLSVAAAVEVQKIIQNQNFRGKRVFFSTNFSSSRASVEDALRKRAVTQGVMP